MAKNTQVSKYCMRVYNDDKEWKKLIGGKKKVVSQPSSSLFDASVWYFCRSIMTRQQRRFVNYYSHKSLWCGLIIHIWKD